MPLVNLESVAPCLTNAIIVPIYKGKGKNPNLTSNYHGIALTSVVGKLFERILLQRLVPLLEKKGIHTTWLLSLPVFLRFGESL